MTAPRTILHADMDAFYAAIEQRDHPELRGKPVIVGGDAPRQVVSTCSYEAREFGVHSAMPGVRAKQLCPEGIFVTPRMAVYAEVAKQVHAVFARFTDQVEPLSLDEAFLDVTGSRALFGDGPEIAARLKREVFEETAGLRVSVGVASSKYVAKVASDQDKPDGLVVVLPGREKAFLAPLSVSRLWGIGVKSRPILEAAGLRTIGDVQQKGRDELVAALGDHLGEHVFVLANGLDVRRVEPGRAAKSVSHEMTFAVDLEGRDEVRAVLLQLCEMVGRRLRREDIKGTVVRIKLRHPDFKTLTRQRKVEPTADDLAIYRVAGELLDSCWSGRPGVRLLGVGLSSLTTSEHRPVQGGLFAETDDEGGGSSAVRDSVLRAMDRIRDRHGESAVRHGGDRKSTNPWGPE